MYIWGEGNWGDGVWGGPTPLITVTALPMETSVRQDGRGTAGVTAVASPMDEVELGEAIALALRAKPLTAGDRDRGLPDPAGRPLG